MSFFLRSRPSLLSMFVLSVLLLPRLLATDGVETEPADEDLSFREPYFNTELDREAKRPQAVRVGGVVFVAAVSAPGGSLEAEIGKVYLRLQSVLGSYGLTMADVAQERIYILDKATMDAALAYRASQYKPGAAPACSTLVVSGLEQEGARVAVELIAVAGPR